MTTIFKGDDTNAFNENFLTVNLVGAENFTISKVIFQCGPVQQVFEKPKFPLTINLSHDETCKLEQNSVCYLKVFDDKGRGKTCKGSISFTAKQRVVQDEPFRRTNSI